MPCPTFLVAEVVSGAGPGGYTMVRDRYEIYEILSTNCIQIVDKLSTNDYGHMRSHSSSSAAGLNFFASFLNFF